tara:strand:+ start:1425 stop:1694 length:270 start_codon:yes stop_codon:yes gene_type:complete
MRRKRINGKRRKSSCSPMKKQELSPEAAKAKAERDLAAAKTPYRKFTKRDAQKKHRDNPSKSHLDYDHTTNSFVTAKKNRGEFGKGTKS